MKNYLFYILLIISVLCFSSCSKAQVQEEKTAFRLPDVPDELQSPEERAAYLCLHYWDHYDFADTALISRPEITEQAFVDFISILPYAANASVSVDTLYSRAGADRMMLDHFMLLASKYLYEPNSPMHNEELHIHVLRALVKHPLLSEEERGRERHRLELAMRNRPGDMATDFSFMRRDGSTSTLYKQKAVPTIVYFNDPECEDCQRVKEILATSEELATRLNNGTLALLSVCVEGKTSAWSSSVSPAGWTDSCDPEMTLTAESLYDLKAMPTLYLLDAEKRVVLKDASVEEILEAALNSR